MSHPTPCRACIPYVSFISCSNPTYILTCFSARSAASSPTSLPDLMFNIASFIPLASTKAFTHYMYRVRICPPLRLHELCAYTSASIMHLAQSTPQRRPPRFSVSLLHYLNFNFPSPPPPPISLPGPLVSSKGLHMLVFCPSLYLPLRPLSPYASLQGS